MPKANRPKGMFTSCASCLQQFHIRASQLAAANGQVRCGACGHQFNALKRLSDGPISLELPKSEQDKDGTFTMDLRGPDYESGYPPDQEYMLLEEFWIGKPPEVEKTWLKSIWYLLAFLLTGLAVGQLAWFNRDQLFTHYPLSLGTAKKICDYYDCRLFRYRDVKAIEILQHDVRTHPLDADSLLVNGILVNKSATGQPYPRIQLAFFDINGKLKGFREFSSQEYLNKGIDKYAIMPPSVPTHFMLELVSTGSISFEFHLL